MRFSIAYRMVASACSYSDRGGSSGPDAPKVQSRVECQQELWKGRCQGE